MRKWKRPLSLLLLCALLLSACSTGGEELEEAPPLGKTVLVCATTDPERIDRASILSFNASHKDVSIEVRDYSQTDGMGRSGWKRLATEMIAGDIPDIIDLGNDLPYRQMARKGYLEDLWPYIENDPELGREGVLEAPLKAAEVDGGLYLLFNAVEIETLAGAESVVGDRAGWTLLELEEAFSTMPEGSTVMEYLYSKGDLLYYMGLMNIEKFIDWDTGTCSFDCEEFRAFLAFCDQFPPAPDWLGGTEEATEEIARLQKEGLQMLSHTYINGWDDIPALDAAWGGRASCPGFPTGDGSCGSIFVTSGTRLAMTSACKNKEGAWQFIRQLILPALDHTEKFTWQRGENGFGILINRADHEYTKEFAMAEKPKGSTNEKWLSFTGFIQVNTVSQEDCQRLEDLLNSTYAIDLRDQTVYQIVSEAAAPYFAGDKSLDDTIALIQNRVKLYVNEQR